MSKLTHRNNLDEDGDDVAGLFRRLDGRTKRPEAYRMFSQVEPAAAPVRKPAPRAEETAAPAPAAPSAPPVAPTPARQVPEGHTPLAGLFARLAAAEPKLGAHSPLARLRSIDPGG